MSQTHLKWKRMRRVHGLESGRLTALVAEVVRIDTYRNRLADHRASLLRMRDASLSNENLSTIELRCQNNRWIDQINEQVITIDRKDAELQQLREQAQKRVMDQRAKVRGLEILVDQLKHEIRLEDESEQMLIADESALQDFQGSKS